MIAFLRGRLAAKTADQAFIDVSGVGYAVFMSGRSLDRLGATGDDVAVFTRLSVREDAVTLYGFASQKEQSVFDRLVTVSGVGPKVALSALGSYDADELVSLIAHQDTAAVQRIPGIGKKTASRIVLELKDSFADVDVSMAPASSASDRPPTFALATEALLSLGFSASEVESALSDAPENAPESVLIQSALKWMGG